MDATITRRKCIQCRYCKQSPGTLHKSNENVFVRQNAVEWRPRFQCLFARSMEEWLLLPRNVESCLLSVWCQIGNFFRHLLTVQEILSYGCLLFNRKIAVQLSISLALFEQFRQLVGFGSVKSCCLEENKFSFWYLVFFQLKISRCLFSYIKFSCSEICGWWYF